MPKIDRMNIFIVLLRAVNVSGSNIIKMADLRSGLGAAGFEDVRTYIQSGNIVLRSSAKKQAVKEKVRALIADQFGLDIEVFVLELEELEAALQHAPFSDEYAPARVFITLLSAVPDAGLLDQLYSVDHGAETFCVKDKVLYFYPPEGMAKSKMNNNYFEKKLKVRATGRNLNTVRKMIELARST